MKNKKALTVVCALLAILLVMGIFLISQQKQQSSSQNTSESQRSTTSKSQNILQSFEESKAKASLEAQKEKIETSIAQNTMNPDVVAKETDEKILWRMIVSLNSLKDQVRAGIMSGIYTTDEANAKIDSITKLINNYNTKMEEIRQKDK